MGQKLLGNSILIAHRGNFKGVNKDLENSIPYLQKALMHGYDIEVDLWHIDNSFYFGHDGPEHKAPYNFIKNILDNSWFHCKNLEAIYEISGITGAKYFWHQGDDFTLTSNNLIWTYPGKPSGPRSIIVDLGRGAVSNLRDVYGICGDYLE